MISFQSGLLGIVMLAVSNAIFPLAILTFAAGFFPYKPFLPGQNILSHDVRPSPQSQFDKVIFMVVDALRSDFVYSNESSFFFTHSLIRTGAAIPFTAHATSPTITMPRVKAMTTGSIPSFLDVILNFAESDTTSTLANQDTWPTQLKERNGGKLLMYGDDTWLKLFPNVFSRADGTSSFFVSDFTEVDNNVTRHLSDELQMPDWDGFVMHYLGLDHIGHKSGPRSPHMIPKQKEMDGIVERIYKALLSNEHLRSTLLVLCGDHGMNDAGNHGGSAPGETSPALVFISPKLQRISQGIECPASTPKDEFQYFNVVEQSDVAPTLAGLLGFPIPLNNLGVIIPEMLKLWPEENDHVILLRQNARQVLRIVEATFPGIAFDVEPGTEVCIEPSDDGTRLWCMWRRAEKLALSTSKINREIDALLEFLRFSQRTMSTAASNYDVNKLQTGVFLSVLSTSCALAAILLNCKLTLSEASWGISIASIYSMLMFASSFIEEEHHFWYWLGSAWLGWLFAIKSRCLSYPWSPSSLAVMTLLVSYRILRRWNQTGQKHAGEPDIARTFLPAHNVLLWLLVAATYFELSRRLVPGEAPFLAKMALAMLASVACGCAFIFKVFFTEADAPELLRGIPIEALPFFGRMSLVVQARVVFSSIGLLSVFCFSQLFFVRPAQNRSSGMASMLHNILSLFLVTQTRATNIPLFLVFFCQLRAMQYLKLSAAEVTLTSMFFQYGSFFALGGSNAISSIDLSSAYNGIDDYNVIAVGLLTFFSNWAGPIWWAMGAHLLLETKTGQKTEAFLQHICLLTFFAASSLLSTMAACTILRTHLFVWTVFSPKYLFSMAWTLGQHFGVGIVLGLVFWTAVKIT